MKLVHTDSIYELTGAVSKEGCMFPNYPLWNKPHKYNIVEITSLTQSKLYPNILANSWRNDDDGLFK